MQQTAALQLHIIEPEPRPLSAAKGLLLPLALFAALSLACAPVLSLPLSPPALLTGAAVILLSVLTPKPWNRILTLAALLLPPGILALSPLRDSAAALANRLYEASEAVNAYAYRYFEAGEAASPAEALPWLAAFFGALCALAARRKGVALAMLLAAALAEAYFGVTPPLWQNLLLFALPALSLLRGKADARSCAALLAGIACVALTVSLLVPRPIASVEAYSEHLRDELGAAAMSAQRLSAPPEAETNRTHQESRQHEEDLPADALSQDPARTFEHLLESERELSKPQRIDWLRIALWLLLSVVLLTAPFLPFLLLNRAGRRREARRAAFADADNAAAIRAMFSHTVDWLRAGGLRTENRTFAQCDGAVEALTSGEYAARYREAARIWQEAAYSGHAMTAEQRRVVRELLDDTAASLYEKANRRTRFRIRYIDCLCGS